MGFDVRDLSGQVRDFGSLFRSITRAGGNLGIMGGSRGGVPGGYYRGSGDVLRERARYEGYLNRSGGSSRVDPEAQERQAHIVRLRNDPRVEDVLNGWGMSGKNRMFDGKDTASDAEVIAAAREVQARMQSGGYQSGGYQQSSGIQQSGLGGEAYERDLAAVGTTRSQFEAALREKNPNFSEAQAHDALRQIARREGRPLAGERSGGGSVGAPRSAIGWLSGREAPGAAEGQESPANPYAPTTATLPAGGLHREATNAYTQDPQLVMHAQRLLNASVAEGQPLAVDGKYGANTERATRAYQRQTGLTETGTIDDATLNSLERSAKARVRSEVEPEPSVSPSSSSRDIARAQTLMNAITISGGQLKVNGQYDAATTRHIKALQTQWGQEATGTLNSDTMQTLERTASKKLGLPYAEHVEQEPVKPSKTPQNANRRAGPYHSPD